MADKALLSLRSLKLIDGSPAPWPTAPAPASPSARRIHLFLLMTTSTRQRTGSAVGQSGCESTGLAGTWPHLPSFDQPTQLSSFPARSFCLFSPRRSFPTPWLTATTILMDVSRLPPLLSHPLHVSLQNTSRRRPATTQSTLTTMTTSRTGTQNPTRAVTLALRRTSILPR